MTREIQLTRGKVALVDDNDFNWLNQFNWQAMHAFGKFYAVRRCCRSDGKQTAILMAREILGLEERGLYADFKNKDTLDCRRDNLRAATRTQINVHSGTLGRRPENKTHPTLPRGVTERRGKYRARLHRNGKWMQLGTYDTVAEASAAYKAAAAEIYGEFF